MLHILLYTFDT